MSFNKAFRPCLAFCSGQSPDPDTRLQEAQPSSVISKELSCVSCGEKQQAQAPGFVCKICNVLNRVGGGNSAIPSSGTEMTLRRIDSGVFQPVSDSLAQSMLSGGDGAVSAFRIPHCSVCLDGVGDIVFMPCAHGGFCEDCARQVAGNSAVGGAHCPRCRKSIDQVFRIIKVLPPGNLVKVIDLEVSQSSGRKAPPKVPPPPGYKKKAVSSNQST